MRRSLTTADRELVLPSLLRNGLIATNRGGQLGLTTEATADLLKAEPSS